MYIIGVVIANAIIIGWLNIRYIAIYTTLLITLVVNKYLCLSFMDFIINKLIINITASAINNKSIICEFLQNILNRKKTMLGKVVASIFKPISKRHSIKKSIIFPKFMTKKPATCEYLSGKIYFICNIINKNIVKIDILEILDIQNIMLYR
jgi:hypothetical protein